MPVAATTRRPGTKKCAGKTEREEHLEQVAKMSRRGWSQWQIARELGVSQPLVCQDLKKIRERYKESMLGAREEQVAEKISEYQEIRREAWAAYDRSMLDADKEVQEFAQHNEDDGATIVGSEVRIKRIVTREGRLPANQFLTTILQTLQAERDLLGLDEVKTVNLNVFNWDALALAMSAPAIGQVESRILELEVADTEVGHVGTVAGVRVDPGAGGAGLETAGSGGDEVG